MSIEVLGPDRLPYFGNRQSIGRAVANLVDNALKYGARSDRARSDRTRRMDRTLGQPTVVPESTHPSGASRRCGHYRRLEEARTTEGSGLGLALARAVARLHGGEIELEDNRPGLRAVMRLSAVTTIFPDL